MPSPGNPMSPPGGIRAYEKKRYAHLDQRLINAREHAIMARMLARADGQRLRILNAPCGFGRFGEMLTPRASRVAWFDLHPEMVLRCREKFGGGDCVRGSIRSLPFRNGSFDLVMNIRFFHHYFAADDRAGMLAELARVSRRWVLITYYRRSLVHGLNRKAGKRKTRIVLFDSREFQNELARAGLRVVTTAKLAPLIHAQTFVLAEKVA